MLFSIVIPVFNGEKTIRKALYSVSNQKNTDFEIIIIDDGSIDNTKTEVEYFIQEYPNIDIKLISNSNHGRSVSRNIGIISAQGQYICFLDADDELKDNHLTEFKKAIISYPDVNFFFADSEVIRQDDNWAKFSGFLERLLERGTNWKAENEYILFTEGFSYDLALGSLIPMCSTAIRKDLLVMCGLFNPSFSVGEDFELWFRISLMHRMVAVNKQLSNVYHHEENTSNPKHGYQNIKKSIIVNKYILENTPNLDDKLRNVFEHKIRNLISTLLYYSSDVSPLEVVKVMTQYQIVKNRLVFHSLKQLFKSMLNKCK